MWRGTDLKTLQDPLLQVSVTLFFNKVLLLSQVTVVTIVAHKSEEVCFHLDS